MKTGHYLNSNYSKLLVLVGAVSIFVSLATGQAKTSHKTVHLKSCCGANVVALQLKTVQVFLDQKSVIREARRASKKDPTASKALLEKLQSNSSDTLWLSDQGEKGLLERLFVVEEVAPKMLSRGKASIFHNQQKKFLDVVELRTTKGPAGGLRKSFYLEDGTEFLLFRVVFGE